MEIKTTIRNLQQIQQANTRRIAALQPNGALGALIQRVTAYTHSQAVRVTHVDTGSLRASHLMEITETRGRVYVNPGAINPRSRTRVVEYAEIEEARGGDHAFYTRAREASQVQFRNLVRQLEKDIVR